MMMALLTAREKCKAFYEKYCNILKPVLRFLFAFSVFSIITYQIGYEERLSGILVLLIMSLICAFSPIQITIYFTALLTVLHVSSVSPVLGFALLLSILSVFLLIVRYSREQAFIIMIIPLFTVFRLSYLVPLGLGLLYGPIVIPAMVIGVIFRYIFMGIDTTLSVPIGSSGGEDPFQSYRLVVDYILLNQEILLYIVGFILTYLVTYFVRRGRMKYASQIGILTGTMTMLITLLFGNIIMDAGLEVPYVIYGVILSALLAYILQFFRMTLDYMGTKKLQFEDEEYYYYVKAVPKINVFVKEETIKLINPKQELEEMSNMQEEFDQIFKEEMNNKEE
jgi:hypothetical protein